MIVKEISIKKFRGFSDFKVKADRPVTMIVGQNGTMKTTLLGIIAQPFSTKTCVFADETRLDGYKFGSQLSDNFNFSEQYDIAGEHEWTLTVDKKVYEKGSYTCLSERRTDNGKLRFWSTEGRDKGMNYIQCPVIYLSLKRLFPMGEERKIDSSALALNNDEQEFYIRKYKEILISPDDNIKEIKHVKSSNKSTVVPTTGIYDEFTVSAGQDNVGKIILSVMSMARLKTKYNQEYKGGIILIDEVESTLYPAAQEKLVKFMFEMSEKYNIQFFCTTHSMEVISYIKTGKYSGRGNLLYLHKVGDKLMCHENPSLPDMQNDLNVAAGKEKKVTKVRVYCEDSIGCLFTKNLLPKQVKDKVIFMDKVTIGWTSYKTFYKNEIPEFIDNIICLDGDVRYSPEPQNRWSNCPEHKNIVFLPGNHGLEHNIYKMLYKKDPQDSFWDNNLGGYDKQKCFKDYASELLEEDHIKQWFKSQERNAGRGYSKFIKEWKKQNPRLVEEFIQQFVHAYNYLANKNGFEEIKTR